MDKKKSKLDKNIRIIFIAALILMAALIAGIPMIVVGAQNKESFGLPVMVIGIIFCVIGFYGSPVAWTSYWGKLKYRRTVEAVTCENFRSVKDIASHLNQSAKSVSRDIATAINKFELVGFTLRGDEIIRIENLPEEKKERVVECPNCGGINSCNDLQHSIKCIYCGRVIDL